MNLDKSTIFTTVISEHSDQYRKMIASATLSNFGNEATDDILNDALLAAWRKVSKPELDYLTPDEFTEMVELIVFNSVKYATKNYVRNELKRQSKLSSLDSLTENQTPTAEDNTDVISSNADRAFLEVYLSTSCNIRQTAKLLSVSRRAAFARLNRIRDQLKSKIA